MTPEEQAYKLAEERIAEANAGGWKFLNISGNPSKASHGGELSAGEDALKSLDRIPPEIAELTWLERLDVDQTQIHDLAALAGLSRLQWLDLNNTRASDLSALRGLSELQRLNLSGTQVSDVSALQELRELKALDLTITQVSDLSAMQELSGLHELYIGNTPLLNNEPALKEIYHSENNGAEIVRKILEWQREHGKLPEAKPPALTVDDLPEQIEELGVTEQDGRMEVRPGAISVDEDEDPLRRKLHERLKRNAGLLQQAAGNRYYRLAAKASRLIEVLDCDFEDLDPVDVWLELEELRVDQERDNAKREDPYEEELLSALALTVDVGGGLVIGTRDVDTLEARRDKMRETATPDSDAAASEVAQQIIDDPTPWGARLRAYLGITQGAEPEESGRLSATRYALVRNAMIAAGGYVALKLVDTATGNVSQLAIDWLVAHAPYVQTFALSMAEGSGAWLIRVLDVAHELSGVAASTGSPPRPVERHPK